MTQPAPPQDAVSVITKEYGVETPCSMSVDVPGAVSTLQPGSQTNRAKIDISVTGCGIDEADHILERMDLRTDREDGSIRIYSDADRGGAPWWRWLRTLEVTIHIDLQIPSPVELELDAPSGEVHVAGLEGHFDLDLMGAPCHLRNLDGTLNLHAKSSDVTIEQISGDDLTARVDVGALALQDVQTNTIRLHTVDAPLSLRNVEGDTTITANSASVDITDLKGPCTARSQGGPLTYDGAPSEDTDLAVVGDTLNVHLPADHAADLTMVGSTLSLDDSFSFDGRRTKKAIKGVLNDGGPPLTLRSISGLANCTTA